MGMREKLEKKAKGRSSRTSLLVAAVIFVLCAAAYAGTQLLSAPAAAAVAVVHDGDGGVTELPLGEDGTYEAVTSLGRNLVVVEDGSVHVEDADCDNHDCMRQGSISQPGQQIVCLPHQLWIEVVDAGSDESGESAAKADASSFDSISR